MIYGFSFLLPLGSAPGAPFWEAISDCSRKEEARKIHFTDGHDVWDPSQYAKEPRGTFGLTCCTSPFCHKSWFASTSTPAGYSSCFPYKPLFVVLFVILDVIGQLLFVAEANSLLAAPGEGTGHELAHPQVHPHSGKLWFALYI